MRGIIILFLLFKKKTLKERSPNLLQALYKSACTCTPTMLAIHGVQAYTLYTIACKPITMQGLQHILWLVFNKKY